ncbi:hypothetical protein NMYAN_40210 [Nitrosomonas nitrosa]|uniref:Uncharacterized protein n=1 Tax=Nitrosomonas nitrosa TaxID=52442 RepID=A0A8H8Z1Z6_9PROT|nr:hypothetical protein NMYAN_40210 [Nitrosomonas nitrosa]
MAGDFERRPYQSSVFKSQDLKEKFLTTRFDFPFDNFFNTCILGGYLRILHILPYSKQQSEQTPLAQVEKLLIILLFSTGSK